MIKFGLSSSLIHILKVIFLILDFEYARSKIEKQAIYSSEVVELLEMMLNEDQDERPTVI